MAETTLKMTLVEVNPLLDIESLRRDIEEDLSEALGTKVTSLPEAVDAVRSLRSSERAACLEEVRAGICHAHCVHTSCDALRRVALAIETRAARAR